MEEAQKHLMLMSDYSESLLIRSPSPGVHPVSFDERSTEKFEQRNSKNRHLSRLLADIVQFIGRLHLHYEYDVVAVGLDRDTNILSPSQISNPWTFLPAPGTQVGGRSSDGTLCYLPSTTICL